MRVPGTVSVPPMPDLIVVHRSAPEAIMARLSAGVHRVQTGVGAARRAFGGTLMALGAAAAACFALLTAWLATEVLGDIVRTAPRNLSDIWAPLRVAALGGLAAGVCALLAWLGRLVLGPRPPA